MSRKMGGIALALLVMGCTINAQAAPVRIAPNHVVQEAGISPRYVLISSIHGDTSVSDGKVYLSGTVSADSTYAKVTITLQSFENGKWQKVASWSATGKKSATKSANTTATPGMIYRTKIYGYVSKDGIEDSATLYTKVVGA